MKLTTFVICCAVVAVTSPACAGPSPARLEATAKARVLDRLRDPESARFRSVVTTPGGTVCGLVNSRNGFGGYAGYRGFIYWPTFDQLMIIPEGPGEATMYRDLCK